MKTEIKLLLGMLLLVAVIGIGFSATLSTKNIPIDPSLPKSDRYSYDVITYNDGSTATEIYYLKDVGLDDKGNTVQKRIRIGIANSDEQISKLIEINEALMKATTSTKTATNTDTGAIIFTDKIADGSVK